MGDARGGTGSLKGADDGAEPSETWHDALLGYMGNSHAARRQAEEGMRQQGAQAGIAFDYGVKAQWQPIESQRLLLWAGRFGLQEEFMSDLNRRHFEERQSASSRATLLDAAEAVGLDRSKADAFLDTDELESDVWYWYGATIREKGIHSIPLFSFSVPAIEAVGGPFRDSGADEAYVVRGSMDTEYFAELLEVIARDVARGKRTYDARANPYRQDEWRRRAPGGEGTCAR